MDRLKTILIVLSICFLTYYYYKQYKNWKDEQSKLTWPREYNRCPDYWVHDGHHICRNVNNIGRCPVGKNRKIINNGKIDFKRVANVSDNNNLQKLDKEMTNNQSLMRKCRWSKICNSSWEGVDKLCA